MLDERKKDRPNYTALDLTKLLDRTAVDRLEDKRLPSWSWAGYSEYFEQYSGAVNEARKINVSALQYIGMLGPDWHPAGYSQIIASEGGGGTSEPKNFQLEMPNKKEVVLNNFGARAFLLENLELNKIDHLILVHFKNLDTDRIPELRGRADYTN
jgi:hypothetical protein